MNVFIPRTLPFIAASASVGTVFYVDDCFFVVREYLYGGRCPLCNYTIQRRTQKLKKKQRCNLFYLVVSAKFMVLEQFFQEAFRSGMLQEFNAPSQFL